MNEFAALSDKQKYDYLSNKDPEIKFLTRISDNKLDSEDVAVVVRLFHIMRGGFLTGVGESLLDAAQDDHETMSTLSSD